MVLFFDIDGTLLSTTGSGMASIHQAAKDAFGEQFSIEGVSFAGCLDTVIVSDMLAINAIADTPQNHRVIREGYLRHLRTRLPIGEPRTQKTAAALPGVKELLAALAAPARVGRIVMGLLTGNYPETGRHKLEACGIDPGGFSIGVWGDDAPHSHTLAHKRGKREDLVPIGMARAAAKTGRQLGSGEFIVIGDTPHDVRCARVHGGRCLAVATGHFSESELSRAGADWVVSTLEQTQELVDLLLPK